MSYFSYYFYNDDLFKDLSERTIDVMVSCKTIPQWESAIKYINLVEDKFHEHFHRDFYIYVYSWSSHKRGFCHGMIQSLRENNKIKEEERLP